MVQGTPTVDSNISNLLPELLLGLLGHTGGAFVSTNLNDTNATADGIDHGIPKLSQDVDWITLPEREQLDNLVRLGHYFSRLEAFSDAESDQAAASANIYRAALSSGLEELLDVYRAAVLQVEQRLLRPPTPPLLAVRHFLSDFEVLLPDAASIVQEVQQSQLNAAQIMALLDRRTRCGIPAVQACAGRLLWHCYRVMFKQLESWMIYGVLTDPGKDFFIQNSKADSAQSANTNNLNTLDGYHVVESALPPGVPAAVANSVLFVGKSIKILRHSLPAAVMDGLLLEETPALSEFSATLRGLQQEESLRPAALRYSVETLQAQVAAMLWDLLQQKCDLQGQILALQSYFLLGKGDFYQQLLQDASGLLSERPSEKTASADWADAFTQAGVNSGTDSDPFFSSFKLTWYDVATRRAEALPAWHPSRNDSLNVPSYDMWDGLCVACAADWPMLLLLPVDILQKYCAVWQFMFRLRRAQMDLEKAWGSLAAVGRKKTKGNTRMTHNSGLLIQLGQLRQRMAHFASNLALYLRVDVAESAAGKLRTAMAAANDFTQADSAHREYVDTLTSQACLDVKQLMSAVEAIFMLIRRLCTLIKELELESVDGAAAAGQASELAATFRLKHNVVFQLLQSNKLQSGPRAAALRQLVVRLNFNSFCEQDALQSIAAAPQLGPSSRASSESSLQV